jgi:hypothetical protein
MCRLIIRLVLLLFWYAARRVTEHRILVYARWIPASSLTQKIPHDLQSRRHEGPIHTTMALTRW